MTTNLPLALTLSPLGGTPRELEQWLTTFHLASVVVDPYTNESSWILRTAVRILEGFRGSDVRVNFVVTADDADAQAFLGPLVDDFLVFTDPDRAFVRAAGLDQLPAFVFTRVDGEIAAVAQGWNAAEWRDVADAIAEATSWQAPTIPRPGDPVAFAGSPALG